jgi:hypothetical protein
MSGLQNLQVESTKKGNKTMTKLIGQLGFAGYPLNSKAEERAKLRSLKRIEKAFIDLAGCLQDITERQQIRIEVARKETKQ